MVEDCTPILLFLQYPMMMRGCIISDQNQMMADHHLTLIRCYLVLTQTLVHFVKVCELSDASLGFLVACIV